MAYLHDVCVFRPLPLYREAARDVVVTAAKLRKTTNGRRAGETAVSVDLRKGHQVYAAACSFIDQ